MHIANNEKNQNSEKIEKIYKKIRYDIVNCIKIDDNIMGVKANTIKNMVKNFLTIIYSSN